MDKIIVLNAIVKFNCLKKEYAITK